MPGRLIVAFGEKSNKYITKPAKMWKHGFTVIGVFTVFSVFSNEVWDIFIKKIVGGRMSKSALSVHNV